MLKSILSQLSFHPVLAIDKSEFVHIDLSKNNPKLIAIDFSDTQAFEEYINSYLKSQNAKVAYGGYNEPRAIYQRSENFNSIEAEERFIHLGIDLWTKAETPIYAPLEGKIHSFQNNKGIGNYGPTIILEHQIDEIIFYTLYGHLTECSIQNIQIGQPIQKGEKFAEIGNYPVNGDYPPHLHFQLIKDLRGIQGDFPGVTSISDKEEDLKNSINPELILGITS